MVSVKIPQILSSIRKQKLSEKQCELGPANIDKLRNQS